MKIKILAALLAIFSPESEQLRKLEHTRKVFIAEIEKESKAMHCQSTQIISHLIECNTNDFLLRKKDHFVETGRFYDFHELALYTMTSTNKDPKNITGIPYGNCEYQLAVSTPNYYDPTTVQQIFGMQCWDPFTHKPITINRDFINYYTNKQRPFILEED
ncbi:MAG: hypothetical protein Q8Q60_01210 [Candidatus Chromulinivorax sp.]|nr:hypothetical protein [Candidatus Chromulinivorax sp.]